MFLFTLECCTAIPVSVTPVANPTAGKRPTFPGMPQVWGAETGLRVYNALRASGVSVVDPLQFDVPPDVGVPVGADLAIARYCALGETPDVWAVGNLSLNGDVRHTRGVLPMVLAARNKGCHRILIPQTNWGEVSHVEGITVIPVANLAQALKEEGAPKQVCPVSELDWDMSDIRAQEPVKRALEIAASGGHHVFMVGPPGSGKTMFARRLPGILPPMTREEQEDVTAIYSAAGILPHYRSLLENRPFRAPHFSVSERALLGTSQHVGELNLAHNGVLFLDEVEQFSRTALETILEVAQRGYTQSYDARLGRSVQTPARFMLVVAMSPCPCGKWGDPNQTCHCTPDMIARHQSGTNVKKILSFCDIRLNVPVVSQANLMGDRAGDTSATIQKRVSAAREYAARASFPKIGIRVSRVASTIANMEQTPLTHEGHMTEALSLCRENCFE